MEVSFLLLYIGLLILIVIIMLSKAEKDKLIIQEERRNKLALNIYNKCLECDIKSLEELDSKGLSVIAHSFNLTYQQTRKYYVIATELLDKKLKEEKEEKLKRIKRDYLEEEENSSLVGHNKYIKNMEFSSNWDKDKFLNIINSALIDKSNVNSNFKLIDISDIKYELDEFNNFIVFLNCRTNHDFKILNKKAVLDGSLKIEVLDNDTVVAVGYLNGKINTKLVNELGYYTGNSRYHFYGFNENCIITCIPFDIMTIDSNKKYEIKISPINLWLMEDIFNLLPNRF